MCYREFSGWTIKSLVEQVLHRKELALKTRESDLASHAQMNIYQQQQLLLQTGKCKEYVISPRNNSCSNRTECNGFVAESYDTAIIVTKGVEKNVLSAFNLFRDIKAEP